MRHGVLIEQYPLRHRGKSSGISHSGHFTEWQAGTAAGLDMWKWENGEYPARFKAKVIAWYESKVQIDLHVADANYVKPRAGKRG